ncbi:rRNA maturation RNase YbeY [Neomoorella thermoacetica]|uniref:Endoribonuclease YbeY n=2 Tax=Neomoorella thermoacetica TaxID=1525 RepID=YBEY_MOOTA|nr:rRNA maturation RNase YbeY [Moorella thermoacetica]Q2RKW4.1 RecName: Full=Endoribonuclease YbeY [Moorella thermoacetica ATCC 39073]AKX93350.1 endoribonuclease YbeY [Moorella thermoacetica]AKX95992.1 endoribonuclease YbeY [Moorella thermoacetica]AOQ23259.1 Endoribonuclease YbeY [Moorella thermoacetica]APC07715.1 endoribonuclease YbeY [Moorella thermoacetica]OIQ53580.1 endoribonuclease YbeY [Moorella thermoacetica]
MECSINNQQADYPVGEELLSTLNRVLQAAAAAEGVAGEAEVSLTLVDDAAIKELNRTYRGVDAPTDVLSFALEEKGPDEPAYADPGGDKLLGDIIISVPTAVRQAGEYGHSLARELAFLAVHGFLHLLGYDHDTAAGAADMEARQEAILAGVGLRR